MMSLEGLLGLRDQNSRAYLEWRVRIWLLLLLTCLISLGITIAHHNAGNTTIGYVFRLMKLSSESDSWKPMSKAIEHIHKYPHIPVYTEIFFKEHTKFQYPLSSLVYLDVIHSFTNLTWASIFKILNIFSLICLPLIGFAAYCLFANGIDHQNIPDLKIRDPVLLAGCLITTVFFYPLTRSYELGQIQTWITLLVSFALVLWQLNKKIISGLLFGICCTIKPQWVVVVLWGVIRRQWGFSTACAGAFLFVSSLAIALYGFQNMTDYIPVLTYISHHGESYFGNQSVNGLVNRFLFNGNNIDWDERYFPPFNSAVYYLTMLSGVALIGTALLWRRKNNPTAVDLALVTLSLTMASPIAWKHHYGVLLPIFALLAPLAFSLQQSKRIALSYLMISYILVSQQLDELVAFTAASRWNFVQSYLLWGGLLVLFLLYSISRAVLESSKTDYCRGGARQSYAYSINA